MESVAYALYDSFKIIEDSGKKITSAIVLNEGGAKSILLGKIITDVFNLPTVLVKRRTGIPFGDAKWLSLRTIIFVSGNCIRRYDISFCNSLEILACLFLRPDLKMVVINSPDNPS